MYSKKNEVRFPMALIQWCRFYLEISYNYLKQLWWYEKNTNCPQCLHATQLIRFRSKMDKKTLSKNDVEHLVVLL